MSPLMIILLCAGIISVIVLIILAKKQKRVLATILGFVAAAFFAIVIALSVVEKPLSYDKQTKENYLAMQEDKNVSGFRIRVDDKIINEFPEWDDENPFNFFVDYQTSEIRIWTEPES